MRRAAQSQQIDQIYRKLGVWGKWQIGQMALLLALQVPAAFQLFSIVFIGYQPDFACVEPYTTDDEFKVTYGTKCYSNSTQVPSCPGDVKYSKLPQLKTIVTEWDLVCSKSYAVQLTQTILILGQAVGATLFTNLADRYGRKRVCIICQISLLVVGVGTAFAPNILVFTLLRFPMGAFQQSLVMTSTVLPMESMPVDQRIVVHLLFGVFWAVSQCLLVVVGYAFSNDSWIYLQLALCSSSLFVVVLQLVIVNALVYFGLNLTSAKLAGNRFLNFFLLVAVEFPAAIVTYFTMKGPGRRATTIIFHAIAGIALVITGALYSLQDDSLSPYVTALSLLGKFAISSSWLCLFNYTTELYPTNARSIGLGFASSASRIGGMLAPFTNLVVEIDEISWLPGLVFGVSSIIVSGLMVLLPETCDKALPQTMEDIESWDHTVGCCYKKSDRCRYMVSSSTC